MNKLQEFTTQAKKHISKNLKGDPSPWRLTYGLVPTRPNNLTEYKISVPNILPPNAGSASSN